MRKQVDIRVLGPLLVRVDGDPVTLRGAIAPTLLAILVFDRGPHDRQELIAKLWTAGELDRGAREASALARLYTVTRELRRALSDGDQRLLETDRGRRSLELVRVPGLTIDLDQFRRDLRAGRHEQALARLGDQEPLQGVSHPALIPLRKRVDELAQRARIEGAKPSRRRRKVYRVADSQLVVIKAILLGWGLEDLLATAACACHYVATDWNDDILASIETRWLDFALYNHMEARDYLASRGASRVRILGSFGHSMGGKNFYILAHKSGRWGSVSSASFLRDPAGATLLVPARSDMYENVKTVLGASERDLNELGVRVIHSKAASLEMPQYDHDLLLVGGQNIRFDALATKDYVELVSFDTVPEQHKQTLRAYSENVMLGNADAIAELEDAGIDGLWTRLYREFLGRWSTAEEYDRLMEELSLHAGLADRQEVVQHILYETYRLGAHP